MYLDFEDTPCEMTRPDMPKLPESTAKIMTVKVGDMERTMIFNLEKDAQIRDYQYCYGGGRWIMSDNEVMRWHPDQLSMFDVIPKNFNHWKHYRTWGFDCIKIDQIGTPSDLRDCILDHIEYNEHSGKAHFFYVDENNENGMIFHADMAAGCLDRQFQYVHKHSKPVTMDVSESKCEPWYAQEVAEAVLTNNQSYNPIENIASCISMIDGLDNLPPPPADPMLQANFNSNFVVFIEQARIYVMDRSTNEMVQVTKLPKLEQKSMGRCVDFTVCSVKNNRSYAKLFIFLHSLREHNIDCEDCTLPCFVGYLWTRTQDEMVMMCLNPCFPTAIVDNILSFVRKF